MLRKSTSRVVQSVDTRGSFILNIALFGRPVRFVRGWAFRIRYGRDPTAARVRTRVQRGNEIPSDRIGPAPILTRAGARVQRLHSKPFAGGVLAAFCANHPVGGDCTGGLGKFPVLRRWYLRGIWLCANRPGFTPELMVRAARRSMGLRTRCICQGHGIRCALRGAGGDGRRGGCLRPR